MGSQDGSTSDKLSKVLSAPSSRGRARQLIRTDCLLPPSPVPLSGFLVEHREYPAGGPPVVQSKTVPLSSGATSLRLIAARTVSCQTQLTAEPQTWSGRAGELSWRRHTHGDNRLQRDAGGWRGRPSAARPIGAGARLAALPAEGRRPPSVPRLVSPPRRAARVHEPRRLAAAAGGGALRARIAEFRPSVRRAHASSDPAPALARPSLGHLSVMRA